MELRSQRRDLVFTKLYRFKRQSRYGCQEGSQNLTDKYSCRFELVSNVLTSLSEAKERKFRENLEKDMESKLKQDLHQVFVTSAVRGKETGLKPRD